MEILHFKRTKLRSIRFIKIVEDIIYMQTIIIAGGSGLVGSRLKTLLENQNFRVFVLTRNRDSARESQEFLYWNIGEKSMDSRFQEADHIINLCGAGIASKKWTNERKKEIISSRIEPIHFLLEKTKQYKIKLSSFTSASAIGYYGDSGNEVMEEDSAVATKEFLSDVCVQWEAEALKAREIATNVTILRIGTVLSASGGALEKMAMTIPYGVANYMGSGKQDMSWIHIEDLCAMFAHVINNNLRGIFNAVAPDVVSNKAFTTILKNTVNPHAIVIPAPAWALKLALGEMSRVVLNSSNISAQKIINSGFNFEYPNLKTTLKNIYQK